MWTAAFDIETTGLDPHEDSVVSIGWLGRETHWQWWYVNDHDSEAEVIAAFFDHLRAVPPSGMIATWAGNSFDWPFLAERARTNQTIAPYILTATDSYSHHNRRESNVCLPGVATVDVSVIARCDPNLAHVSPGLKNTAEHFGYQVKREGAISAGAHTIARDALEAYNHSDCDATLSLFHRYLQTEHDRTTKGPTFRPVL